MTQPAKPVASRATPIDRTAVKEVPAVPTRGLLRGYLVAIGFTVAAFFATLAFKGFLEHSIFLFFWPAVFASAWFGGLGPALLASVGGIAVADYYFIEPKGINVSDPQDIVALAAFLIVALLTTWAVRIVSRSRDAAMIAAAENANLARKLEDQGVELSHQLEESQAMQEELELSSEELAERTAEAENAERYS